MGRWRDTQSIALERWNLSFVPTGTPDFECLNPTVETVGYCRMSLAGQIAVDIVMDHLGVICVLAMHRPI